MYMYIFAGLVPPPQAPGNKSQLIVFKKEELKAKKYAALSVLHPPHTHTLPHCPSHTSLIRTSLPLSPPLSLFSPPISTASRVCTCIYTCIYIHVHACTSNYGVVHVYTHSKIYLTLSLSLPISPSIPHSLSFYPSPSLSLHLPPSLAGPSPSPLQWSLSQG